MKLQLAWDLPARTAYTQHEGRVPPENSEVICLFDWDPEGKTPLFRAAQAVLRHHGLRDFTDVKVEMENLVNPVI